MDSRKIRRLIAALSVGTLVIAVLACGSQKPDEPAPDDGPSVQQEAASPQPAPTSPSKPPQPSERTEATVTSSDARGSRDPWGDDADPFKVTSIIENGKRYEVAKVLSKDAIPAIFSPSFFTTDAAFDQYRDTDLVIGVSIGDEHRAYNVAYLSGHEIVNDVVGGKPVAVTW